MRISSGRIVVLIIFLVPMNDILRTLVGSPREVEVDKDVLDPQRDEGDVSGK